MLAALGAIATLPWKPLDANDRAHFADAGPDARIAGVPLAAQGIGDLLDWAAACGPEGEAEVRARLRAAVAEFAASGV